MSFNPPDEPEFEAESEDCRLDLEKEEESFLLILFLLFSKLFTGNFVSPSSTCSAGVSTIFATTWDDALLGKFTGLTKVCSSREALWTKKESDLFGGVDARVGNDVTVSEWAFDVLST